ncbi:hypothetical protein [Rurimicrobium arvi]|uniref:Uncharacterized protein n=1 Tax=Rurimicrobium arvi TaxID=2049916 RepID=A0ABP8MQB4_9BACT
MKKINILAIFGVAILYSCTRENESVELKNSSPIDSMVIATRIHGIKSDSLLKVKILDKTMFDTIYRDYFTKGRLLKDYYVKFPINKYNVLTYRHNSINDTVVVYKDHIRIAGVGVIKMNRNIEPLFDSLFNDNIVEKTKQGLW